MASTIRTSSTERQRCGFCKYDGYDEWPVYTMSGKLDYWTREECRHCQGTGIKPVLVDTSKADRVEAIRGELEALFARTHDRIDKREFEHSHGLSQGESKRYIRLMNALQGSEHELNAACERFALMQAAAKNEIESAAYQNAA